MTTQYQLKSKIPHATFLNIFQTIYHFYIPNNREVRYNSATASMQSENSGVLGESQDWQWIKQFSDVILNQNHLPLDNDNSF